MIDTLIRELLTTAAITVVPVGYIYLSYGKSYALAAAIASVLIISNVPPHWLYSVEKATLSYLAEAELQTFDGAKRTFKAEDLWTKKGAVIMVVRRPGCVLCRDEAVELSSLKPQLDGAGIPLYAVVHEELGVPQFSKYFKGEVYLDKQKRFYGPKHRKMLILGLLRFSTYHYAYEARKKGVNGNLKGDGTLLGGVYVIGSRDQGIIFEHREMTFGDTVNITSVQEAIKAVRHT